LLVLDHILLIDANPSLLFTSAAGKVLSYSKNLTPMGWTWGGAGGYGKGSNGFTRFGRGDGGMVMGSGGGGGMLSHSSTVEKLYAWEKKLFLEVKVRVVLSLRFNFSSDGGFSFAFSFSISMNIQNDRNILPLPDSSDLECDCVREWRGAFEGPFVLLLVVWSVVL